MNFPHSPLTPVQPGPPDVHFWSSSFPFWIKRSWLLGFLCLCRWKTDGSAHPKDCGNCTGGMHRLRMRWHCATCIKYRIIFQNIHKYPGIRCHFIWLKIDFDFEMRMALTAWRSPARPFTPALALGDSSQAMPMPESSDAKAGQFNGSRDKKSLANTKASGTLVKVR